MGYLAAVARPNFFIVGAPKCGTTSLASWLAEHPDIFMSPVKEPHFFNTDQVNIHRHSPEDYERLFSGAGEERAVGEASTWYLASKVAVPNILEYNPDARFIVCVRDPVDMAFSLHRQTQFVGVEPLSDFRAAWAAQERRALGIDVPRGSEKAWLLYGEACRLGRHLQRLYTHTDNVHVVFLDDLVSDPRSAYRSVLRFLDVSEVFSPAFEVRNEAKARRLSVLRHATRLAGRAKRSLGISRSFGLLGAVDKWNRKPAERTRDEGLEAELRDYFRDDVKMLAELTGRNLDRWLERAGPDELPRGPVVSDPRPGTDRAQAL